MSVLKHYDSTQGKWVVDAPNARDVRLDDPHYTGTNGAAVSVDDGMSVIGDKLNQHSKQISWLYHNKGEGGTGGGTTETTYTLALYNSNDELLSDGNTIYTSSDSVNV